MYLKRKKTFKTKAQAVAWLEAQKKDFRKKGRFISSTGYGHQGSRWCAYIIGDSLGITLKDQAILKKRDKAKGENHVDKKDTL